MLCRTKGVHAGLGFLYNEGGSLLTGVSRHGNLCCRAGCHPDERSRNSFLIDLISFWDKLQRFPRLLCQAVGQKVFKVSEL